MTVPKKPERYDHLVMMAQIRQESGFNPHAISKAGAQGLMQLMPPTFKEWSKILAFSNPDPFDPLQNMLAGLAEMNRQVRNFKKLDLALTAYNFGSGRLKRLIIEQKTDDLEKLKPFLPLEARQYAQLIFNHYADPDTAERMDDYIKVIN